MSNFARYLRWSGIPKILSTVRKAVLSDSCCILYRKNSRVALRVSSSLYHCKEVEVFQNRSDGAWNLPAASGHHIIHVYTDWEPGGILPYGDPSSIGQTWRIPPKVDSGVPSEGEGGRITVRSSLISLVEEPESPPGGPWFHPTYLIPLVQ